MKEIAIVLALLFQQFPTPAWAALRAEREDSPGRPKTGQRAAVVSDRDLFVDTKPDLSAASDAESNRVAQAPIAGTLALPSADKALVVLPTPRVAAPLRAGLPGAAQDAGGVRRLQQMLIPLAAVAARGKDIAAKDIDAVYLESHGDVPFIPETVRRQLASRTERRPEPELRAGLRRAQLGVVQSRTVEELRERRHAFVARLSALWLAGALTAVVTMAGLHAGIPHSAWLEGLAWVALGFYAAFPSVGILHVGRDLAAIRKGGAAAVEARQRLAGFSVDSHLIIKFGKIALWPAYLATGSPALFFNTVVRVTLSWIILTQFRLAGKVNPWKYGAITAGIFASLAIAGPYLAHFPTVAKILGMAGSFGFAFFQVPQFLLNRESIHQLRSGAISLAELGYRRLQANRFYYYLFLLIADVLMMPLDFSTGIWYKAAANAFIAIVTVMILAQMGLVNLLPWQKQGVVFKDEERRDDH